jgi:hypothetical protein
MIYGLQNAYQNLLMNYLASSEKVNSEIMIFTDLCLIDEKNNIISESFYTINEINPESNLKQSKLFWNSSVYGCSVILNRKLLNASLPIPEFAHA